MFLLSLLFACANPKPVALQVCQAIPGLATDARGMELMEPLLAQADLKELTDAQPTLGLQKLGSAMLDTLRDQVECEVLEVESAGGAWADKLERSLPEVLPDGTLGPVQTRELQWQVVKEDGLRIQPGLRAAAGTRRSAEDALQKKDYRRFASTWRAIYKKFPDPLITVDIAAATEVEARWAYRENLAAHVLSVKKGELTCELENSGERPVAGVQVDVRFAMDGKLEVVPAQVGPVASGGKVQFAVAIPAGAKRTPSFKIGELQFE